MVSIHCPPGYEPGALPLRHSAVEMLLCQLYKIIYLILSHDLTITGLGSCKDIFTSRNRDFLRLHQ
jgi:hypothetical protein